MFETFRCETGCLVNVFQTKSAPHIQPGRSSPRSIQPFSPPDRWLQDEISTLQERSIVRVRSPKCTVILYSWLMTSLIFATGLFAVLHNLVPWKRSVIANWYNSVTMACQCHTLDCAFIKFTHSLGLLVAGLALTGFSR